MNGQGSDALCSLSVRLLMVRGGSKRAESERCLLVHHLWKEGSGDDLDKVTDKPCGVW